MNRDDGIPKDIIVPVIAAIALNALVPLPGPSREEKVAAAFAYADLFTEQLRKRGLTK